MGSITTTWRNYKRPERERLLFDGISMYEVAEYPPDFGRDAADGFSLDDMAAYGGFGGQEPEGFTQQTDRSFHAAEEGGWWEYTSGNGPNVYNVSGEGDPEGDDAVARLKIPAGVTGEGGGSSPSATGYNFSIGYSKVYVAFTHKLSSNYQGHDSSINKLGVIYDPSIGAGDSPANMQCVGVDNGPFHYEIKVPQTGGSGSGNGRVLSPNDGSVSVNRDTWYLVEIYAVMNSAADTADGTLQMWINGERTQNYSNIIWSNVDRKWTGFKFEHVWGGTGDLTAAEIYHYLGRAYASTQ